MTSMRPKNRHVSYALGAEIRDYLKPLIEVRDAAARLVVFKNGLTDEDIARRFSITIPQAAHQRVEHFGHLWKRTKEQEQVDRLDALEARIALLEAVLK